MTDDASGVIHPIQREFTGPLPSELADLYSLTEDFKFARDCAAAYLNLGKLRMGDRDREVLKLSLWNSAAISYRRAFASGRAPLHKGEKRLRIPDSWHKALTPAGKKAHDEILKAANEQIAHQTGHNEQFTVAALLQPPPMPRGVGGMAVFKLSVTLPTDERVNELGNLCESLVGGLQAQFERRAEVFQTIVREHDIDELYDSRRNFWLRPE